MEPRPSLTLSLPPALADALRAEALRQLTTPSKVAVEVLKSAVPGYVSEAIRRDLSPPIEASATECPRTLGAA